VDANQTRYHLLLGKDDWGACSSDGAFLRGGWLPKTSNESGFDWHETRHELTLQALPYEFAESKGNRRPLVDNRRGSARDRFGNWYWIDSSERRIRVRSSGSNVVTDFWKPPTETTPLLPGVFRDLNPRLPAADLLLRGLTVTDGHYLVVGVHREGSQPAGLLIFDLHGVGEPVRLLWPNAIAFAPFDMSPAPDDGLWILDRVNRRYWRLDRHFNVVHHAAQEIEELEAPRPDDFQSMDAVYGDPPRGDAGRTFPRGIRLEAASPLALEDPFAIEGLPDGTLLILDRRPSERFSAVYRYHFGSPTPQLIDLEREITEGMDDVQKARASLTAHDFAFLPYHRTGEGVVELDKLFVTALTGDQTYVFHLRRTEADTVELNFLPAQYSPMRLFSGKALVGSGQGVYYDIDELWVPLIAQNRPRYVAKAELTTPIHQGADYALDLPNTLRPVFDGRDPDCVWHRLLLDACIPGSATVEVFSRAANTVGELAEAAWQQEPPLRYWRTDGSELPFAPPLPEGYHTWEILFQNARGRYLQLKLRLSGSGQTTPRLRAMRVYYPRFSYLDHYLPTVYREDRLSASLLDRFLANVEGIYTAIEDRIADVQILFDPLSTPADALDWLAGWFGVALDPAWEEDRRRLFIQYAALFFQYRGTVRGLKMALHLALADYVDAGVFAPDADENPCYNRIRIVERFRTVPAGTVDKTAAHRFSVLLPTPRLDDLSQETLASRVTSTRDLAARIIDLEKPAHTLYDVRYYWGAFRLGEVRLGVDTLIDLGSRSPQFIAAMLLNEAYLGEAYLAPGHPQNVSDRLVVGRNRLDETVGYSAYAAPHREDRNDE
jgi:phage tail-like protein